MAVEGQAQVTGQVDAVLRPLAGLLVEQRPAVLAGLLRLVHRDVGVAQDVLGLGVRGTGHDHAQAGGNRDLGAAQQDVPGHGLEQAAGDLAGRLLVAHAPAQDGELVTAEARHDIAVPDRLAQPLGHLEQELVAGLVAERVVDLLEVVEVQEEQRRPLAAARPGRAQVGAEELEQASPVQQAGQRVVPSCRAS